MGGGDGVFAALMGDGGVVADADMVRPWSL
jgi:hypothetical protein